MRWWNEQQLRSADASVRITAAQHLAQSPAREALPALIRAMLDPDPIVQLISGCRTNVIGLPMTTTSQMLTDVGVVPTNNQ